MATRKASAAKSVEAVEVEAVEEVAEAAPAPVVKTVEVAPVQEAASPSAEGVNPLLQQDRKEGIPNNTWTLWYGNAKFDCVQGQARMFPTDVYNYLKRAGNLIPPNF